MSFFSALLKGQSRRKLVLSGTTIVMSAAQVKAMPSAPSNTLYTPNLLYKDGNTYLIFALGVTNYHARAYLLPYFEGMGLDRPIPVGPTIGSIDGHPRPSGIFVNNRLNIVQEHTHDTSLYKYKPQNDNDVYTFSRILAESIGTSCSYPQIHTLEDDTFFILGQTIDSSTPGGNFGDVNFVTFGADTQIADNGGGGTNVWYPSSPNQKIKFDSGWRYWMLNHRPTELWQKRYLFKTKDFITHYNWDESFNATNIIDDLDFPNFLVFDPGGGAGGDGYQSPAIVTFEEHFFTTAWSETLADYVFIFMLQGDSSATVRALGLSDYVENTGSILQLGAVAELCVIGLNDIRIFVRRNPAGDIKIYQYQSNNLGVSWTLLGDVFSDISGVDFGRFTAVSNIGDIPNNKNFFFVAAELTATALDDSAIYIKKAAFGALQPEPTNLYTGVTGYTFAEYNALMMRSYYSDDALITRSGTNVLTMVDQSPTNSPATVPVTSPIFNTTDGDFISFNGAGQFMVLTIADIQALTQGTIFVVAKADTTTNNRKLFLCGSVIGTANKRIGFGCNKAAFNNAVHSENCLSSVGSGVFTNYGDDDVGSGWHIFCYQYSDKIVSQHWMDGKKQFYNWNRPVGESFNRSGNFFSEVASITRISLGRLSTNVTEDFDFKLKHISIMSAPMTFDQLRKAHRYLADRYSITLTSIFQ